MVVGQYPAGNARAILKNAFVRAVVARKGNGNIVGSQQRIDLRCVEDELLEDRLCVIVRHPVIVE